MNEYRPQLSTWEKLTTTTEISGQQAAVIKQTYALLAMSVFFAMLGGYVGATSEFMVEILSTRFGWLAAILVLNAVPWIAMSARHNPVLGVTALVFDGFLSGLAISPLLFLAARVSPSIIVAACMVTAVVFIGITGYIMISGRSFSAPRGIMVGMFFAIMGAMLLNTFVQMTFLGLLISIGIGIFGVIALVSSTSTVLRSPEADTPIPGALMLFAGLFNVFVATLSILLRLMGGGRRS